MPAASAAEANLRVGFIGSGWTDSTQIPAFRLGGLTPQAIASQHPERAREVAARHGLPAVFDTWQALIASDEVDIVSICTPPDLHMEIAVAALRAGKHVISEKPTALSVPQAEAMLAAAQAAPNQLAIIDHELRFHPQRLQMRQMIKEGYVGSVLHVHLDRLGGERLDPNLPWDWWCDVERGGGMLNALGSHLLDLARWLVGRIESLTAQLQIGHLYRRDSQGIARQVTADDHAHLLLRFANGAQGSITASGLTPGGWGMSILVVGTEGALKLDNQDGLWGKCGDKYPGSDWEAIRPRHHAPATVAQLPNQRPFAVGSLYLAQMLAMSLPMGEMLPADAASFYDGLVVQRALDAARTAHRSNEWVRL